MSMFFVNSNAVYNNGHNHNEWLARQVIIPDGPPKFRQKLMRPAVGDIVLVYANGMGVILRGEVTGVQVMDITGILRITTISEYEYHRKVRYTRDLRSDSIIKNRLIELIGYAPSQTIQRITQARQENTLEEELNKRGVPLPA